MDSLHIFAYCGLALCKKQQIRLCYIIIGPVVRNFAHIMTGFVGDCLPFFYIICFVLVSKGLYSVLCGYFDLMYVHLLTCMSEEYFSLFLTF